MKRIRKILLTVFSFVFVLALGLSFAVSGNKKVKAAVTETEIQINYVVIEPSRTVGSYVGTYTFVTNFADTTTWTEQAYQTCVYFNGQRIPALANNGYFYVERSSYDCAVGETFLLEIPAGTYYQSNAVVANDVIVSCTKTGDTSFSYVSKAQSISETPYSIELNKLDWALSANTSASAMYVTILDPNKTIKSGLDEDDWVNDARYTSMNAVKVNGEIINAVVRKVYADNGTGWENAYVEFSKAVNDGDVVTFDGWFTNATYGSFKIEKTLLSVLPHLF